MKYKLILSSFLILIISTNSASAFLPLGQDNLIIQNIFQNTGSKHGTYNQTLANNGVINSGGYKLNFINGTGNPVNVKNSTNGMVNVTISAGAGAGVTSLNALNGALTIACVSGNTTCTTSGGNTITINTAFNIATLNLNEVFTGVTTMNSLKLGGQMDINGNTMKSNGHVYTWPSNTGTVCLTNQTGSCGSSSSTVSINGLTRGTFTGIIANQTFPAPKVSINSVNSSSFTFGGGVGISVSNSSTSHTIKNIGVVGLAGSGATSVSASTGNVTISSTDTNSAQVIAADNGQSLISSKFNATETKLMTLRNQSAYMNFNHNSTTITPTFQFKVNNITCSNQFVSAFSNSTGLFTCASGGTGTVTQSQNVGHAANSVGVLATPTSTTIKGRNFTGTSPVTITKTNDTDVAVGCPTCLVTAIIQSQNAGKATGSVGVLATPTSSIIKGRNITTTSPITITKTNDTDISLACSTCLTSALIQTQNAGKATGSIGMLATQTASIVKSRNVTAASPLSITLTNNTDVSLACSTCLTSALVQTQNVGKATGSVGTLATQSASIVKSRNFTGTSPITVTLTNNTDIAVGCSTCITSAITQAGNVGHGANSIGTFASITGGNKLNFKNATAGVGINVSGNTTDFTIKNIGVVGLAGTSGNFTCTQITGNTTCNTGNNIDYLAKTQTLTGTKKLNAINDSSAIVDSNAGNKKVTFLNSGATASTTLTLRNNQTTSQGLNWPKIAETETIAVKPQINFTAQANRTGTTNTGPGVMLGPGTRITPEVTGRIQIYVTAFATSSVAADGCNIKIRWGTGGDPLNGAVPSGTVAGSSNIAMISATTGREAMATNAQVTGLTIGTPVWIQLVESAVTGGTCTIFNVNWSVFEL